MICTETLKAHVSPEIKLQAKAVAEREFLSEGTWLKRLVLREIRVFDNARGGESEICRADDVRRSTKAPNGRGKPILVCLRAEDRLLLNARSEARGMRPFDTESVSP